MKIYVVCKFAPLCYCPDRSVFENREYPLSSAMKTEFLHFLCLKRRELSLNFRNILGRVMFLKALLEAINNFVQ